MDLYALAPEEFTAARDAAVKQAKADGDKDLAKALGALRRPTASAHAVNALVRADPDLLGQLLELGQSLAQAQRDGEADDLKSLGAQRRQLVEAVADQAGAASGKPLGAAARTEVVSTLEAALADSASGEAVRTGRLVRALSYAGFGEVDLDGAVAPESGGPDGPHGAAGDGSGAEAGPAPTDLAEKKAARELAKQVAAAERRSQQAHGALDDAVRGHERAVRLADQAALTLETADSQVERAEEALQAARDRQREARLGQEKAADELNRTTDAVSDAQDEAEQSRAALDELRRS